MIEQENKKSVILELYNVTKSYKDASRVLTVIRNLNQRLDPGVNAIVGRSGVGKSTLLHLLGGLDSPSGGELRCGEIKYSAHRGRELARFRGANIGFVFQFHHLLPEFSAEENVAMPLIIQGVSKKLALERARVLLLRVGLGDRLEHLPSALSGGESQRVAVARALVAKPRLVLADEPTGNLDRETAEQVIQLIFDVTKEESLTTILVTHDISLAERADRIFEMVEGGDLVRT